MVCYKTWCKTKNPVKRQDFFCAQDRSRTDTSVISQVFETSASTNSATWAFFDEVGSGFEPL